MQTLEVRKERLDASRIVTTDAPGLEDGQVLARVDRFALTANNVTYGVVGERIGYWRFFPAASGWGVIPVWGFGEVTVSRCPQIAAGERLYGYFPMGTHAVLQPAPVRSTHLVDASPHRAALPRVYNSYTRVDFESGYDPAMDDERMLLYPLYATSFCLYDFLMDNEWFGSEQIVIASASSKTAIGLALALAADPSAPPVIGLTSPRNLGFVDSVEAYTETHAYDELAAIGANRPTVIVDMSGNGSMLSALHAHLADNMRHCANVGVTHYERRTLGPGYIAERSAMFFAPGHIQKRSRDWGPGVFEQRAFTFWQRAAAASRRWLEFERYTGMAGAEAAYQRVLAGDVRPDRGVVVQPGEPGGAGEGEPNRH